jgi:hypothetical protein
VILIKSIFYSAAYITYDIFNLIGENDERLIFRKIQKQYSKKYYEQH